MIETINKLVRASRQMLHEYGREPTPEELAHKLNMPLDKVRKVLKIAKEPISLETPIGDEEDSHLGDFIEDKNAVQPLEAATLANLREATTRVLATLTPREERVLRMRFGIGMNTDHTLEEVGQQFSVTRERIRQIEAKALRKLKHPEPVAQAAQLPGHLTLERAAGPACPPARPRAIGPALPGPVAQRLELAAHNGLVVGSNPAGPTTQSPYFQRADLAVENVPSFPRVTGSDGAKLPSLATHTRSPGRHFGASVSGPRHFVSRRRVARDGGDRFARSAETGSRLGARGCRGGSSAEASERNCWESRSGGELSPSGLQPKHLPLARPLDGWIDQPRDADAARQPTFDRGPDQIGRQEGQRDGHVDVTPAAALAAGDRVGADHSAADQLVEPAAAKCDRPDQRGAGLGPDRAMVRVLGLRGRDDLPAALGGRSRPGDLQHRSCNDRRWRRGRIRVGRIDLVPVLGAGVSAELDLDGGRVKDDTLDATLDQLAIRGGSEIGTMLPQCLQHRLLDLRLPRPGRRSPLPRADPAPGRR